MKVTKNVEKKEVKRTVVDIVESRTYTFTLSEDEASLLRTGSYIVESKLEVGTSLRNLFKSIYESMVVAGVPANSVQMLQKQFVK